MKRLILLVTAFVLILALYATIRFFQFDPSEAMKESLEAQLGTHFVPAAIEIGPYDFRPRFPFEIRADRFSIAMVDSGIVSESAQIPISAGQIFQGSPNPDKLFLERAIFTFLSVRGMEIFLGNPFSAQASEAENASGNLVIEGEASEFLYSVPKHFLPDLSLHFTAFSLKLSPDGFRNFHAEISNPEFSGAGIDLSSDPERELVILNLLRPEKFSAKAEFYPDNSRTAFRLHAVFSGQDLSALLPLKWKTGEFIQAPVKGKLSAHSAADGTLRARTALEASAGVLHGINLPYEVLSSLSRLPLLSKLMEGEWQTGLLKGPKTFFDAAEMELAVNGQDLIIEELIMTYPDYDIVISGGINFSLGTGTGNLKGEIFITGNFAEELIKKEPLLAALAEPDGLRLAFVCLGKFPGLKVETDINDASSRILRMEKERIAAKGIDSLNRYMESKK